MREKVVLSWFSATGNTKKSLLAMGESIGEPFACIDMTLPGEYEDVSLDCEQFLIIGAPAYAGRIPAAAKERFKRLHGDQTPCIPVISFGNRDIDDALLELSDLMTEQGFRIIGGAALIGRHTYGEIQVDRPDANDLKECGAFAAEMYSKSREGSATKNTPHIPGNRPYRKGLEKGEFHPETTDACVSCGLCVEQCPFGAIAPDCRTISDACMSCFRCIRECPVEAKVCDSAEYKSFVENFINTFRERKENRYYR